MDKSTMRRLRSLRDHSARSLVADPLAGRTFIDDIRVRLYTSASWSTPSVHSVSEVVHVPGNAFACRE